MISALVLLGAVGFTLVAAYQWAGLMWQAGSWRCEIGKATFGKATSGTPYSPSSSGWFGFTARKHSCPEEVPRGERRPADVIGAAVQTPIRFRGRQLRRPLWKSWFLASKLINKTGHSQIQNSHGGMEMGQHQMRHEGRQLRRRVDQTIWRLLKLLKPNAFSARKHNSSGSRSPSRATSTIRFAMISRTSTTLADLLTPLPAANPFSAMRASLRR